MAIDRRVVLAFALAPVLCAQEPVGDLRGALEELASRHGFALVRAGRLDSEGARRASGPLEAQLKVLLADYNYAVVATPDRAVEKVVILGRKQARPRQPDSFTVPTTRQDAHHVVEAELVGNQDKRLRVALLVDTGATSVVLPSAMIAPLGFAAENLQPGWTQTANGKMSARHATLAAVQVGGAVAEDVAVTFVEDKQLGGNLLLGMSFLGRFQMTIDDSGEQLTLIRR